YAEAEIRRKSSGPNRLESKKRKSVFQIFISELNDWLIYVRFAAVIITVIMAGYIDSGVMLVLRLINAAVGGCQGGKACKAIDALKQLSVPKALIKRNSHVSEISSEELVPGDIVILEAGRVVPADLRLIEAVTLQTEESALTGESLPVTKDAGAVHTD